ncbi:hypothetical protein V1478_014639 [Vespula squamosa]|uniref:Uncharacterized protein n=1 Tax=Vespula squamosa TaxID=30214 RepID=A0ABD2A2U4_VESSQ
MQIHGEILEAAREKKRWEKIKGKRVTLYYLELTDVASDGENYVSPKRIALNLLSLIVPQADHKVDEYFLRYVETHRRPRVSAPNITADQIGEIIKRFVDNALRFRRYREYIENYVSTFSLRSRSLLLSDNLFNKLNEALKESEISEGRVSSFNYERSRSDDDRLEKFPTPGPQRPRLMPRADALVAYSFLLYCDFTDPVTSGTTLKSIKDTVKGNSDTFFRGTVKAKNEDDCVGRNVNKVEKRIDGKEGKVCERREPMLHHPVTGPTSFCH